MLLIKAYAGDGTWDLYEADADVRYLGSHSLIEAPDGDHDYWNDERFPGGAPKDGEAGAVSMIHLQPYSTEPDANGKRYMRWVTYRDRDHRYHMVVSDGPIYICNERGDTIESLRC